jgi:cob(I)alamin adenosyltransferase
MKKSSIYTKAGDRGRTSIYTGEVFDKSDSLFSALGDIDELNSSLGLVLLTQVLACCHSADLIQILTFLQSRLIDVGSALAVVDSPENEEKIERVKFDPQHVLTVELWIDGLDAELPTLTQFILPSGGEASARMHMARAICRRAERSIVKVSKERIVSESVLQFVNRVSDLLFVVARTLAMRNGTQEITYKKAKQSSE